MMDKERCKVGRGVILIRLTIILIRAISDVPNMIDKDLEN